MIGIRISAAIRLHYLRHLFNQSIHVLDSLPPGYAVGTLTSSSNTLQAGISEKLAIFIEYTTLVIGCFVVAFVWSWELSLVTMAGFFAVVLVAGSIFPLTVKGQARKLQAEKQAASIASECFSGIKMIMACGAQRQSVDKYGALVKEVEQQAQSTNLLTSLQFSLTVSPSSFIIFIFVIMKLVLRGFRYNCSFVLVWSSYFHEKQARQCRGYHRVRRPTWLWNVTRLIKLQGSPKLGDNLLLSRPSLVTSTRNGKSLNCRLRVLCRDRRSSLPKWIP